MYINLLLALAFEDSAYASPSSASAPASPPLCRLAHAATLWAVADDDEEDDDDEDEEEEAEEATPTKALASAAAPAAAAAPKAKTGLFKMFGMGKG